MSEPALFRRRPHLRDIPFVSLGDFPTPVTRVYDLLPRGVELWVKHEDRAAVAYGGNKVRKLEFLLAEARARGARRVVTIGGWGSHHALATAIYARQLGMQCELLLFPQPMNDHVRDQLAADRKAHAEVVEAGSLAALVPRLARARLSADTYYVAAGGSSVTGTLGWVSGADEIGEQVSAGVLPRPHALYVALGSSGTVAGLLAGLRGEPHAPDELVAVRVVVRPVAGYGSARALEDATLGRISPDGALAAIDPVPLRVVHDQIGAGYGHDTPAALAACEAAARAGLTLEPTYTGKAMAALIADAESGILDGKRVLFVNTYAGH